MATRVTIILDSGAFLPEKSPDQKFVDVGYFETSGASDITVSEDGTLVQSQPNIKLGNGKQTIDVQHLAADGSLKVGVTLSPSFTKTLLLKMDLYGKDVPDFDETAFDCTFRFHSGDFDSSDVKPRLFKEQTVSRGVASGNDQTTKPIAHDVLVNYDLEDGEILRIVREDGKELWSTRSAGSTANQIDVKVLADASTTMKYYDDAIQHKSSYCWVPNPADPPPVGVP
jgi:hypothetical protein